MALTMMLVERVTCPKCHFEQAVVVYRAQSGFTAQYCPECNHRWRSLRLSAPSNTPPVDSATGAQS